jgi:hypothetical protein
MALSAPTSNLPSIVSREQFAMGTIHSSGGTKPSLQCFGLDDHTEILLPNFFTTYYPDLKFSFSIALSLSDQTLMYKPNPPVTDSA